MAWKLSFYHVQSHSPHKNIALTVKGKGERWKEIPYSPANLVEIWWPRPMLVGCHDLCI